MPTINHPTELHISIEGRKQVGLSSTKKESGKASRNPLVRLRIWFQNTALYLWAHGLYLRIKALFKKDETKGETKGDTKNPLPKPKTPSATSIKSIEIKDIDTLDSWNPWTAQSLQSLSSCKTIPSAYDLSSASDGALASGFDPQKAIDLLSDILAEGIRLLNAHANEALSPEAHQQLITAHSQAIHVATSSNISGKVSDAFETLLQLTDNANSTFLKNIHRSASLLKNQFIQRSLAKEIHDLNIQRQKTGSAREMVLESDSAFANKDEAIACILMQAQQYTNARRYDYLTSLISLKKYEKQSLLAKHLLYTQSILAPQDNSISHIKDAQKNLRAQIMDKQEETSKNKILALDTDAVYKIGTCRYNNEKDTDSIVDYIIYFLLEEFDQVDDIDTTKVDAADIIKGAKRLQKTMVFLLTSVIHRDQDIQRRCHHWDYMEHEALKETIDRLFLLKQHPDCPIMLSRVAKAFRCEQELDKMEL